VNINKIIETASQVDRIIDSIRSEMTSNKANIDTGQSNMATSRVNIGTLQNSIKK